MCIIHSSFNMAIQVHPDPDGDNPGHNAGQPANLYSCHSHHLPSIWWLHHHHSTRYNPRLQDHPLQQRLRLCAPPRIRSKHHPLQRNLLPHLCPQRHHRSPPQQLLHQPHKGQRSLIPDSTSRRVHHRRWCFQQIPSTPRPMVQQCGRQRPNRQCKRLLQKLHARDLQWLGKQRCLCLQNLDRSNGLFVRLQPSRRTSSRTT